MRCGPSGSPSRGRPSNFADARGHGCRGYRRRDDGVRAFRPRPRGAQHGVALSARQSGARAGCSTRRRGDRTFDIQVLRGVRGSTIVSHTAIPIAIAGLLLQAASGVVLLSAEASTLVKNPAFQFKMAMLTFALANMAYFIGALAERSNLARRSTAPRPSPQCRLPAGYWCCWPAAASPICNDLAAGSRRSAGRGCADLAAASGAGIHQLR